MFYVLVKKRTVGFTSIIFRTYAEPHLSEKLKKIQYLTINNTASYTKMAEKLKLYSYHHSACKLDKILDIKIFEKIGGGVGFTFSLPFYE